MSIVKLFNRFTQKDAPMKLHAIFIAALSVFGMASTV